MCSKSVVLNLGLLRCFWSATPRRLHHQLCWLGFLGFAIQKYLSNPRLRTTALSPAKFGSNPVRSGCMEKDKKGYLRLIKSELKGHDFGVDFSTGKVTYISVNTKWSENPVGLKLARLYS